MADKITNESLIKTTQIQQKTAEGMVAIRPETSTNIVLNTSGVIGGNTVEEVFDNALQLGSSDGTVIITPTEGGLDLKAATQTTVTLNGSVVSDPSFYAPTASGTANQVLISSGANKAPVWTDQRNLSVGSATHATNATNLTDGNTTYTVQGLKNALAGLTKYMGSASEASTITGTAADSGDFYRASGDFTFNSQSVHSGDLIILKQGGTYSTVGDWEIIHTGDNTNTWREIQVNGTAIASGSKLNLKSGTNVTLTTDTTAGVTAVTIGNKISVTSTSVTDGKNTFSKYTHPTTAGNKHIPSGGTASQFLIGSTTSGQAAWTTFNTNGFVKRTSSGYSIDTNTYLTANQGIKINSGKKADGSTDIKTATASGTEPILGDSGVGAGIYSAVRVNAKGIAVAGQQVVLYYAKSSTTNPATDINLVNGGFALVEI